MTQNAKRVESDPYSCPELTPWLSDLTTEAKHLLCKMNTFMLSVPRDTVRSLVRVNNPTRHCDIRYGKIIYCNETSGADQCVHSEWHMDLPYV